MEKISLERLTGPQKAAIFFLAMGEEFTTSFFQHLDEESIKKIGKHMSEITYVPSRILNSVLDEFITNFHSDRNLVVSGRDFLEEVVSKTLDEDTAREVFRVIGSRKGDEVPFSELAFIPADTLVNIIRGEHPQTIALILSYLPQEKAADVLGRLPEETRADVGLRIVKIGQVHDELVRELDDTIKRDLSRVNITTRKFDGVEKLANILNEADGNTEESVLTYIEKEDSDLAERIRQKMFVFEDLLLIDDKGFREILQNVENQVVAKALKTASDEMSGKIFKNLSQRAAEMLREDMEVMGPVRLREVEEAQMTMIKTAKRLESEGRIVLAKGKEDVLV